MKKVSVCHGIGAGMPVAQPPLLLYMWLILLVPVSMCAGPSSEDAFGKKKNGNSCKTFFWLFKHCCLVEPETLSQQASFWNKWCLCSLSVWHPGKHLPLLCCPGKSPWHGASAWKWPAATVNCWPEPQRGPRVACVYLLSTTSHILGKNPGGLGVREENLHISLLMVLLFS
jgi:hypothetical protein